MTNPDISIPTSEVRSHASFVDEIGRMLQEAAEAAQSVRDSSDSYGILVNPLIVVALNLVQGYAVGEIQHAVSATNGIADQLRAMADNLDASDQDAAARVRGVEA